jgi:hypothetical protein
LLEQSIFGLGGSGLVETVRRWLHRADLVWRRPRPVVHRPDPRRQAKLRALRGLLSGLPADQTAVFQDEVDVNLNPKIGSMWMRRGQQAELETPGDNAKRYLAGSMNWRTGTVLTTEGTKRDGKLFVRHLEDLRHRLRCYRVIHVICDNARFHQAAKCKQVQAYRGLLMTGRYPVAFLFLEMPPDQVDVNVHPTKAEVRFRNKDRLYEIIR